MSEASAIPSWAVRGASVVCVDDARHDYSEAEAGPLVGGLIYVIDRAYWSRHHDRQLVELVGFDEWCFPLARFRPITASSVEDDMAIFRPILDQAPREVERA